MTDLSTNPSTEASTEPSTKEAFKEHVKDPSIWKRLLFMIMVGILYSAAEVVLCVVVLFQFLNVLITGSKNDKVLAFGAQLSTYAYQIFRYLTFNSEEQPFPIGDWPSDKALAEKTAARKTVARKPAAKKAAPKTAKPAAETATE